MLLSELFKAHGWRSNAAIADAIQSDLPEMAEWVRSHPTADSIRGTTPGLALEGHGNLACGWIGTLHYSGDRLTGAHAMIAAITDRHEVVIIEPQNGKIYAPENAAKLGGNLLATRMVVHRIIF